MRAGSILDTRSGEKFVVRLAPSGFRTAAAPVRNDGKELPLAVFPDFAQQASGIQTQEIA